MTALTANETNAFDRLVEGFNDDIVKAKRIDRKLITSIVVVGFALVAVLSTVAVLATYCVTTFISLVA